MAPSPVNIIYGAANFAALSAEERQATLDLLAKYKVKDLDTARIYPGSEDALGKIGAPAKFNVSTKAAAFSPGALSKKGILESMKQTLTELGVESVDIYYFHSPDPDTPIEESLEAINELYQAGKFKKFGLSNFRPADVQNIYDICIKNSYPPPKFFQGNYNPLSRHIESDLFPLLHKLGISFNAYSPLAGGFLVKSAEFIQEGGAGRWDSTSRVGELYHTLYNKPKLLAALKTWEDISKEAGVSKAALAYRYLAYSSALSNQYGDSMIIGASRISQLEETLKAIEEGPLDEKTCARINELWENVKDVAPLDNYNHEKL